MARPRFVRALTARFSRLQLVLLLVLACAGVAVHANGITTDPWAEDEVVYLHAGHEYVANHNFTHQQGHPPFGKYMFGVAEAAFGPHRTSMRIVSLVSFLVTAALIAGLLFELGGPVAALAGLAAWIFMPHPTYWRDASHLGFLEAPEVVFMMGGLWAGYRWLRTHAWRWLLIAAVCAGLSTSVKQTGILTLGILALWWIGWWWAHRRARTGADGTTAPAAPRFLHALALCVVAGATFVATYLPLGLHETLKAWHFMYQAQHCHAALGHPIVLAGKTYTFAPWWAVLWAEWHDHPVLAVLWVATIVAAIVLVRRRAALLALAALAVPLGFIIWSPVMLYHYAYQYAPAIAMLVGLVGAALWQRRAAGDAGSDGRIGLPLRRAVVLAALAAILVSWIVQGWLPERAADYTDAAAVRRDLEHAVARVDNAHNRVISHFPRAGYENFVAKVESRTPGEQLPDAQAYILRPKPAAEAVEQGQFPSDEWRRYDYDNLVLFVSADAAPRDIDVEHGGTDVPDNFYLCGRLKRGSAGSRR